MCNLSRACHAGQIVMSGLRLTGPLILAAMLIPTVSLHTHAQTSHFATANPAGVANSLPNAPTPAPAPASASPQQADAQSGGVIYGTVLDTEGADISDAVVTLENTSSRTERSVITDNTGSFKFDSVEPGQFTLTVTSTGFESLVRTGLALQSGQVYEIPAVELKIAAAVTSVQVNYTRHDLAEDQMHAEEKQRVLGVFPNFYASYVWNAAPLSPGQKFRLALRTSIDPVTISIPLFFAATEQSQDAFNGYGQGTEGFAKRFGASYTDGFTSVMFTGAILPSILHQDPRYFYKGHGSIPGRALYAISTVVICKGDNGHWEPNYSNVFGNLASASISNAYYPAANRGIGLTMENWLIGNASGAIGNLFQEFVIKKMTRGVQSGPRPLVAH